MIFVAYKRLKFQEESWLCACAGIDYNIRVIVNSNTRSPAIYCIFIGATQHTFTVELSLLSILVFREIIFMPTNVLQNWFNVFKFPRC